MNPYTHTHKPQSREHSFFLDTVPKLIQYFLLMFFRHHNIVLMVRQIGKTHLAIIWSFLRATFTMRRNPMWLTFSLTDGQVRKNFYYPFLDLLRYFPRKWVHSIKNEGVVFVKRPFVGDYMTFYYSGIEKGHSVRGDTCDGMVLDEVQFFPKDVVQERLLPFCKDRDAPWLMISTIDRPNWFWKFCKYMAKRMLEGEADRIRVAEINIKNAFDSTEQEIEDLEKLMSRAAFQGQYMNNPYASTRGVIFNEEWDYISKGNQIGSYPFDPRKEVFTLWDLGVGANLICWVGQFVDKKYIFIDVLVGNKGEGTTQVCRRLKDKYKISYAFLPHDGATTSKLAGKAHIDLLREYIPNIRVHIGNKPVKKSVRLEGLKPYLYQCYFDKQKCYKAARHLSMHAWAQRGRDGELTGEPEDGPSSHYCDSLSNLGSFDVPINRLMNAVGANSVTEKILSINRKNSNNRYI